MEDREPAGDHDRLLEEQLAFQDRELEHCRTQIRELWTELASSRKRLERLERLIESKLRGGEEEG